MPTSFTVFGVRFPPAKRLRGVTVAVGEPEVWRGEAVDVRVDLGGNGDGVEVGLVCVEFYEGYNPGDGMRVPARLHATAHEEWRPLAGGGVQTERFTVPLSAPFTFRGEVLVYEWTATVRRGRAAVDAPLVVLP